MDFVQWRRSISELCAVTEKNLAEDESPPLSSARFGRAPPSTAQGRYAAGGEGSTSCEEAALPFASLSSGYPARSQPRYVDPPSSPSSRGGGGGSGPHHHHHPSAGAVVPPQTTRGGLTHGGGRTSDFYLDSSLAYKIDNLTLLVSVVQKDFEHHKTAKAARDEALRARQDEADEAASAMRGEWQRWEKRMAERMNYIEEAAVTAQSAIYKRVPGVGLAVASAAAGQEEESEALKAQLAAVTKRLTVVEQLLDREDRAGTKKTVAAAVEDELDMRMDDFSREAGVAARKAAANEVKCRMETQGADAARQLTEGWARMEAAMKAALAEQRASIGREVESSVSQAMQAAAAAKQSIANVLLWRDVVDKKVDEAERERAAQGFRLKQTLDERVHELRVEVEKLVSESDARARRRTEQACLGLASDERVERCEEQLRAAQADLRAHADAAADAVRTQLLDAAAEVRGEAAGRLEDGLRAARGDLEAQLRAEVDRVGGRLPSSPQRAAQAQALEAAGEEAVGLRGDVARLRAWVEEEVAALRVEPARAGGGQRPPLPATATRDGGGGGVDNDGGWSSGYDTAPGGGGYETSTSVEGAVNATHLTALTSLVQAVRTLQDEVVISVQNAGTGGEGTTPQKQRQQAAAAAAVSPLSPGGSPTPQRHGYVPDAVETQQLLDRFKQTTASCNIEDQLEGLSLQMSESDLDALRSSVADTEECSPTGAGASAAAAVRLQGIPGFDALLRPGAEEETPSPSPTPTRKLPVATQRVVKPVGAVDNDGGSTPTSVSSDELIAHLRSPNVDIDAASTNT